METVDQTSCSETSGSSRKATGLRDRQPPRDQGLDRRAARPRIGLPLSQRPLPRPPPRPLHLARLAGPRPPRRRHQPLRLRRQRPRQQERPERARERRRRPGNVRYDGRRGEPRSGLGASAACQSGAHPCFHDPGADEYASGADAQGDGTAKHKARACAATVGGVAPAHRHRAGAVATGADVANGCRATAGCSATGSASAGRSAGACCHMGAGTRVAAARTEARWRRHRTGEQGKGWGECRRYHWAEAIAYRARYTTCPDPG